MLAVQVTPSGRERFLRRRSAVVTAGKVGVVVAGLFGLTVYAQDVWLTAVRGNPAFAIGGFEYRTNGAMSASSVAAEAGLRADMHIMDIDLDHVRRRLEALPKVKSAVVERRLPGRLAIQLEERLPVAWMTGGSEGIRLQEQLAVDGAGRVIPCREVHASYVHLPILAVHEKVRVVTGEVVQAPEVQGALELLGLMRGRQWTEPQSVRGIDVPNTWTLAVTVDSKARYTFRLGELTEQLDRLQRILAETKGYPVEVATVNLQPMRNVPVTFMAGAAVEVVEAAEVVEEEVPVVTARGVAARPGKVETKATPKAAVKVPAKVSVKPEVKVSVKPEVKVPAKAVVKPEVKAAVKPAASGVRSVRTAADQRKRDQQTILKGN